MKFNILDYSQRIAISLKLDLKDLHILGWIQNFYPKMKKMIIDGEEYVWLNYQSLIEDMPILEIETKDALYRRLKNLVKIGLLKHRGVKNEMGSYSYYKITEKVMELLEDRLSMGKDEKSDGGRDEKSDGSDQKPDGKDEKSDRVGMKSRNKDNPTSNNSSISSLEETKKYFSENNFKSNPVKFWNYWEKIGWKSGKSKITNRESAAQEWEDRFKEMNPLLYIEKSESKTNKEIDNLKSKIEAYMNYSKDYINNFAVKTITKTENGFLMECSQEEEKRLKTHYSKILEKFKIELEIV